VSSSTQSIVTAEETSKNIRLEEWLERAYEEPWPSLLTARRWARTGHIWPPAEKHGRAYYVKLHARYIDPSNPPADLKPSGRYSP
jgi:hypothetical protein